MRLDFFCKFYDGFSEIKFAGNNSPLIFAARSTKRFVLFDFSPSTLEKIVKEKG